MARPWKKQWPRVSKGGLRSYRVGFRDHLSKESTKSFPSAKLAGEWMDAYATAERRGVESLRRFLLDLDAKEANGRASQEGVSIGRVIELYFAFNAPEAEDGLAASTFRAYRHVASRHLLGLPGMTAGKPSPVAKYAVAFADQPAYLFNEPAAPRALREAMREVRVGPSARAHAWRVLSAVLSWAATSRLVPDIESNGCLLANERVSNRRKSMRATAGQSSRRRHGAVVSSWALSPHSVELIRTEMLSSPDEPPVSLVAHRNAIIIGLQFGLALRNQEVFGLCWAAFADRDRAHINQVLSSGVMDSRGKTAHATNRTARVPSILAEDLEAWRRLLRKHGFRARAVDFVIPGNITGSHHGVVDPATNACHMSSNQAQQWRARYMRPAVTAVAESDPLLASLGGATPYSLRRGGISARLRGENAQSVADQCGTSLEMLSRHYSYEIDGYGQGEPESLDQQWRRARSMILGDGGQSEHDFAEAA